MADNTDISWTENKPNKESALVSSILATLFCCLPLGVVAIVYATQADSAYEKGDFPAYQSLLKKARSWRNWCIGLGLLGGCAYGLLAVAGTVCY